MTVAFIDSGYLNMASKLQPLMVRNSGGGPDRTGL